jgi:serine/threonine protein kinase
VTPQRWARIKELFGEALDRPQEDRAAFLQQACAGDEELRADIDRLLAEERNPKIHPAAGGLEGDLEAGFLLGRYQVQTKLGQGGMGAVYKAYDTLLGRPVALKLLAGWRLADEDSRKRLAREARAASSLRHPNIVVIYDVGRENGRDFIAMEYVSGRPLDAVIPRNGLKLKEILQYGIQIADALAAAHAAGIVHRDVKPGNILVTEAGEVKVLDFGLAKAAGPRPEQPDSVTLERATGMIVGTPSYISPEQVEGGPVDARGDIFSFGAVLYEMATGQRAFQGASVASITAAILHSEPKPAREISAAIPHELERIISRCLRKDPGKRLQTIADVKVLLSELREEIESPKPRPAELGKRRRWRWIAVTAGLLAVAAVAVRISLTPSRDEPSRVVPLTSFAGDESWPAFSPDGSQVAFVWDGERRNNQDVYVKLLDSPTALRLTSDPAPDAFPAWSPDGTQVAFVKQGEASGIYSISPLGGSEHKIANFLSAPSPPSWSPDGKFLAAAKAFLPQPEPGAGVVYLISVADGSSRPLLVPPSGRWYKGAAFSPDGRKLAYSSCTGFQGVVGHTCELFMVDMKADFLPANPRRLAAGGHAGFAWAPDSESLISTGLDGADDYLAYLWRIPVSGRETPRRLDIAGRGAVHPNVVHRGSRLALTRISREDYIARVSLFGPPEAFLISSATDGNPEYSPDGRRIVFTSTRGFGGAAVWLANSDGTGIAQLTKGDKSQGSPSWSPDGRWIAFDEQDSNGKWQIHLVEASGGHPRQLTEGSFSNASPRWSRDGKHIYFGSNRTGRDEIWRIPAQGGPAGQITREGGITASESTDGKTLYYVRPAPASPLFSRSLAGGEERKLIDQVWLRNFIVLTDCIYYLVESSSERRTSEIRYYDLATGRSYALTSIEGRTTVGFSVSPDRRTFLLVRRGGAGADLMLVDHFR